MKQFIKDFFKSNEWYWRLARTIVQGILGVVIANLDTIFAFAHLDAGVKTMIVACCMAILSPIMAEIGKGLNDGSDDL